MSKVMMSYSVDGNKTKINGNVMTKSQALRK